MTPPQGFTRREKDVRYTAIYNPEGKEVAEQFEKDTSYDSDAFIYFQTPVHKFVYE